MAIGIFIMNQIQTNMNTLHVFSSKIRINNHTVSLCFGGGLGRENQTGVSREYIVCQIGQVQ